MSLLSSTWTELVIASAVVLSLASPPGSALVAGTPSVAAPAGSQGPHVLAPTITLTPVAIAFNNPIGIDHHEPTNKVVMSVYYPSGIPYNFELVAGDGTRTQFSGVSGLTEEVKIASGRSSGWQGGFTPGELFTGAGVPGVVARIAPDGSSIQNPWVTLPGETGLMRGSLFQDRYCAFGGNLIVVTTKGGVWRVTSGGAAVRLTSLGTRLEGVSTVPNDSRYGSSRAKTRSRWSSETASTRRQSWRRPRDPSHIASSRGTGRTPPPWTTPCPSRGPSPRARRSPGSRGSSWPSSVSPWSRYPHATSSGGQRGGGDRQGRKGDPSLERAPHGRHGRASARAPRPRAPARPPSGAEPGSRA